MPHHAKRRGRGKIGLHVRPGFVGVPDEKAMRQTWLDEHPGEDPLPEHLCELDHPYPGFKRWATKARRWLDRYETR
jgi:hypothetical protein